MDIQYYGANCIVLTTKGVRIVVDDNLADVGAKSIVRPGDILLYTGPHGQPKVETKMIIDQPGEYEVSDISIYGISAQQHMDEADKHHAATMYKLIAGEVSVLVTGHVYPELSDDQLETVGMVDVMCIPVGGNGYTLDPVGALKLIKKIEPKVVVPTHYDAKGFSYPVPQQSLEQALHSLAMEPKETTPKLKVRPSDLSDVTQLVVVEQS